MKPSQTTLAVLSCILLGLVLPAAAMGEMAMGEMPMAGHKTGQTSTKAAPTEAEVRKVYPETGKVTLKHAEIKNLEMPGMTMQFPVKDKTMLKGLAAGDKVLFTAEMTNGEIIVTSIAKRKP